MFTRNNLAPSFIICFFNEASNILCDLVLEGIETVVLSILADNGFLIRFRYFNIHCNTIGDSETKRIITQRISHQHCLCPKPSALVVIVLFCTLLLCHCRLLRLQNYEKVIEYSWFYSKNLKIYAKILATFRKYINLCSIRCMF